MTEVALLALAGVGAALLYLLAARWPKEWLPRSVGVGVLVVLGSIWALFVWGFLIEPELLVVRQVAVASSAWRGPPLRIGLISDTHADAPHGRADRLRWIMQRMNDQHPDIVVLAGDYVGGHEPAGSRSADQRARVEEGLSAFALLRAPLGVYAVLGNHDWWYDPVAVAASLQRANVALLENSGAIVRGSDGMRFYIAGLRDMYADHGRPDPVAALAHAPPDIPTLMLGHEPDAWPAVPARVALMMAGHSHCGQVDLPLIGRPIAASPGSRRWPCGLYGDGARQLYVTGGTGVSGLPVRFNQPPEIVVITLTQARR